MAAIKGIYTHLVAGYASGGWLFSGQSNSLEVAITGERAEDTRFQSSGKTYVTLAPEGEISQEGYFDDVGAGNFEQEMAAAVAGAIPWHVAALFGTQINACPAYVADTADVAKLNVKSPAAGLITLSGAWGQGLAMRRGVRAYQGVISATGATAYIDLGAAGNGGYGYLWVYAKTGTVSDGSIALQCDDNTGFASPTTLATFSGIAGLVGVKATLAGAIDRYVRLNTTSLGGATNLSVLAVIVANGVTQGVA